MAKKKELIRTFSFPYCKECELILFKFRKSVSQQGVAHRVYTGNGFEHETDFDCNDIDVLSIECPDCFSECTAVVELPIELADNILNQHKDDESFTGVHLDKKYVKDFDPTKAKEILFESLVQERAQLSLKGGSSMTLNEDGTLSVYSKEEVAELFKKMKPRRYRCTSSTDYGRIYYYLSKEVSQ